MAHRIPPPEVVDHITAARDGIPTRGPGTGGGGGATTRLHKLSRRQVRKRVRIAQLWQDSDGQAWRVVNVHRRDGLVALQGPAGRPRFVSFGVLASSYRLLEGS